MKMKMTTEEQVIANEILCADTDWQTITEKDLEDFSLADDPYRLPDEAEKERLEKHFAFRWIENDVGRLKQIMNLQVPMKWWPCNRTNTPFLEKRCSDTDGAVHCQDQILVFKPFWMLKAYQKIIDNAQEAKLEGLEKKDGLEEDGLKWSTNDKIGDSDVVLAVSDDENE